MSLERIVTRTLSHEYVNGIEVAAYRDERNTPFGPMNSYSEHWSTPGESAVKIERLFTEDQLIAAVEAARAEITAKVTRVDIIDHRSGTAPEDTRPVNAYRCRVELMLQDEERTLKVFINDRPAEDL